MIKRVTIAVASGRGVAERWREAYYQKERGWLRTTCGDAEEVYNKLCDLGPGPGPDAVSAAIGNKSWTHIGCSGCGAQVVRAACYGTDYSEGDIMMCISCLDEGRRVLSEGQ